MEERVGDENAVPCQDRQHLVAVQRHRPTRQTSAAAVCDSAMVVLTR